MPEYVKVLLALAAVATSFLLGFKFPACEFVLNLFWKVWALYGAYIFIWLEQHATFFVVLCVLCALVVATYTIILFPAKRSSDEDPFFTVHAQPLQPLREHFQLIQDRVDFDQLLPRLFEDKVISDEEIFKIRHDKSRSCQTMHLVHTIEKKGRAGVKAFTESLARESQNLGHKELASELKRAYPELFPAVSDEDNNANTVNSDIVPDGLETTQPKPCRPKLHLDTVMNMNFSFNSDLDAKNLKTWGLQIFPPEVMDTSLFIAACLAGNFELPLFYELVSPVFYFWSEASSRSVKFDMQHSVDAKTAKQATCLSFVAADTSTGPPFRFSLIEGGVFNPKSSTGVISTQPQGFLAIVKKKLGRLTLRTEPQIQFDAQIFYTWDTPMDYECTAHFVITPSTAAWQQTLNEHYKTAEISGEKIDISFLKSSITLLIPDEGVLVKGWKITCFTSKTISYDAITKTTNSLNIHECKLRITWEGDEDILPTDENYKLYFSGSHQKRSESYIPIQARCPKGRELKGLYGWHMNEDRHRQQALAQILARNM